MRQALASFTRFLQAIEGSLLLHPKRTLAIIILITLGFATQIPGLKMYSDFSDLLPQHHPYIRLHNQIRDTFGGANVVVMSVEVDKGDIFTNETLKAIDALTKRVDMLPSVNHNMVVSLTHRTTRKVWLSEEGDIKSEPYFDPVKKHYSKAELADMRNQVLANPRVFGIMVSPDLKAALIKGTLNEGAIDYSAVFKAVQDARRDIARPGLKVYAVGQPVLIGWVRSYTNQVLQIFAFTALIMLILLVLYFRSFYGVLVPLIAIVISSIWGLGTIAVLGLNLDPLTLVIPFLISARALSHGIQIVQRYYYELPRSANGAEAAKTTFESLFRPGALGVASDAIGILLISLGSIPINTKLAYYGALWAVFIIPTVIVTVPVILSLLPTPRVREQKESAAEKLFERFGALFGRKAFSKGVLVIAGLCFVGGLALASRVQIGEAEPGSPLLYRDHDYNISATAINKRFPGSEEMFVIARTDAKGGIKHPEVLHAINKLKTYMLEDPELGGVKAVSDLVMQVNRLIHSDDPRWLQIPDEASYVGGLFFTYMASSPVPGALAEFIDSDESEANIVLYYKDHQGRTIRRAKTMLERWINDPANQVEGLHFDLAGGIIGVTAASNDAAFSTNLIVLPAVLFLIFVFVAAFYWSVQPGLLMLGAMTFATALSYAYMGLVHVGINVNTVPVIAVGVGVGIDYSIYIMDRIREEMRAGAPDVASAVSCALRTTGQAVSFTAFTLISGIILWAFVSDLRFQADAALLLCVMIALNALAALTLVPAWISIFKPKFIVEAAAEAPQGNTGDFPLASSNPGRG